MELPEKESYARHLYHVARYQARRLTLSAEDREDCAMEFVGRMLLLEALEGEEATFHSNAWLHRCARRHALNWSRALRRQEPLTQPFPQADESVLDSGPTPEELFLSRLFWQQLAQTLGQLPERPGSLFVGFYLEGYTTKELAQVFRMTPHAVEQSLLRSRRRLRDVLAQKGWNDAAILERLAGLRAPVGFSVGWKSDYGKNNCKKNKNDA